MIGTLDIRKLDFEFRSAWHRYVRAIPCRAQFALTLRLIKARHGATVAREFADGALYVGSYPVKGPSRFEGRPTYYTSPHLCGRFSGPKRFEGIRCFHTLDEAIADAKARGFIQVSEVRDGWYRADLETPV